MNLRFLLLLACLFGSFFYTQATIRERRPVPLLRSVFDAPVPVRVAPLPPPFLNNAPRTRVPGTNALVIGGAVLGGLGVLFVVLSILSDGDPYSSLLQPGLLIASSLAALGGAAMLLIAHDMRKRSRVKLLVE